VRIADHSEHVVPSPVDHVSQRVDLAAAWRTLDARDQEVLALTSWDGLSAAQAGQVLGISAANYRIRLHRARAALKRALDPVPGAALSTAAFSRSNLVTE